MKFGRPLKKDSKAVLLTAELTAKLIVATELMDKYALSPTGQEVRVLIGDGIEISKAVQAVLRGRDKGVNIQSRIAHLLEGAAVIVVFSLFAICGVSEARTVNSIPTDKAIRVLLGEGENQGLNGMTALGEALRNRGTLRGVYGYTAIVVENGAYYRITNKGLRQIPNKYVIQAKEAWEASRTSNLVHGGDHWENVKAFGYPDWVSGMVRTAVVKDHEFYMRAAK